MIVGIAGTAGSGKTTLTNMLIAAIKERGEEAVEIANADPMKFFVREVLGVSDDVVNGPSQRRSETLGRSMSAEFQERFGQRELSARIALQTLGTEWGRNCDPNMWINYALRRARKHQAVVISDIRFENEAQAVIEAGGIILKRPARQTVADHPSETEADKVQGVNIDCDLESDYGKAVVNYIASMSCSYRDLTERTNKLLAKTLGDRYQARHYAASNAELPEARSVGTLVINWGLDKVLANNIALLSEGYPPDQSPGLWPLVDALISMFKTRNNGESAVASLISLLVPHKMTRNTSENVAQTVCQRLEAAAAIMPDVVTAMINCRFPCPETLPPGYTIDRDPETGPSIGLLGILNGVLAPDSLSSPDVNFDNCHAIHACLHQQHIDSISTQGLDMEVTSREILFRLLPRDPEKCVATSIDISDPFERVMFALQGHHPSDK